MSNITPEDIRRRLRKKSAALQEVLSSEAGKLLMEALETEFYNGELLGADPYETYYRLGSRDVVVYLHQLQRNHEREENAT